MTEIRLKYAKLSMKRAADGVVTFPNMMKRRAIHRMADHGLILPAEMNVRIAMPGEMAVNAVFSDVKKQKM